MASVHPLLSDGLYWNCKRWKGCKTKPGNIYSTGLQMSHKIDVHKNFTKFTGKHLC